jgi:spore maturation protein CgeB
MKDELKILFLGADGGDSLKRAQALRRLGHEVKLLNPYSLFPFKNFVGKLIYYTGAPLLESYLKKRITPIINKLKFDVVFIDSGDLVGANVLRVLPG